MFERHAVLINIRAATHNLKKYSRIFYAAIVFVFVWYMVIAIVPYFTFKHTVKDYVTRNILPVSAFSITVDMMFCINALCAYPL